MMRKIYTLIFSILLSTSSFAAGGDGGGEGSEGVPWKGEGR